jgi:hypothetical protein
MKPLGWRRVRMGRNGLPSLEMVTETRRGELRAPSTLSRNFAAYHAIIRQQVENS